MGLRLADRLSAARRRQVVGRATERALFESTLGSAELPFLMLWVFGPGGIGKTTLLREYVDICEQMGLSATYLDARDIEPSADSFLNALRASMGLAASESPTQFMAANAKRFVLLVDTYEVLSGLDNWLRESFLPQLPERVFVVLAGREPPSPAWRADPGWQALLQVIPLRNLSPEESRAYLAQRNVPAEEHQAVLNFTHGHPLALSLVADVFAQRPNIHFKPETAPNVIKTLLEQFVQKVPGPAHRAALEACALVHLTSQPLLAEMLGVADARELFDWLRGLSFIESGPLGLFPHDLAREALTADLRWRYPDWYGELHRRARSYYTRRLQQSPSHEQQRILLEYIFLHRDNIVVRQFFEWQESGNRLPDVACDTDQAALLEMVALNEGPDSARLAEHWLARQPEGMLVFRDAEMRPAGFMALVALEQATSKDLDADPAIRAAWNYLQAHAPLRRGERATHFRFWMARDTYQAVSSIQSMIFVLAVQHYLVTPGLAFTFFPCANADFWQAILNYADLARLPEAEFDVGPNHYGVYGHDWRAVPPTSWLTLLAEREMAAAPQGAAQPHSGEQLVVLSQPSFASAVREAFRDYLRLDALRSNPLIRSRLIVESAGRSVNTADRAAVLQGLIRKAAESFQASPRDAKLYRALYHTYFKPAPTQEKAAELLDLPFSTYRRHLMAGIAQITDLLWQQEIGGATRQNQQK